MESAQAFIAFLHCEAQQAEDRAKSLRATAATIEANSSEDRKGKKHAKRKRGDSNNNNSASSSSPKAKRPPTAYTLFVHENFEMIKSQSQQQHGNGNTNMSSKDVIALVAQQWAQTSDAEKQMWQYRADQLRHVEHHANHISHNAVEAIAAAAEDEDQEESGGGNKKRAARKRGGRQLPVVNSVTQSVSV